MTSALDEVKRISGEMCDAAQNRHLQTLPLENRLYVGKQQSADFYRPAERVGDQSGNTAPKNFGDDEPAV